jgi:hypothetical protein
VPSYETDRYNYVVPSCARDGKEYYDVPSYETDG